MKLLAFIFEQPSYMREWIFCCLMSAIVYLKDILQAQCEYMKYITYHRIVILIYI